MDEKHERESQAKGGSVPPDMRRHSKARVRVTKVEIQRQEREKERQAVLKRDIST
jgi:hypothetical protein